MKRPTTIISLMRALQRRGWFKGLSWTAWKVVLKALFAISLSEEELQTFASIAGRRQPPSRPVREAWFVVGRRGGKSLIAALLALFLSTCVTYRLAPGERGVVMIVAADRRQARVIFRYVEAFFTLLRPFADLVERKTQESLCLTNGLVIEIHTSSFRAVRGYTVVAAICDEIAFWSVDGANPDEEILNAIRPAMATVPTALLICLSSPYARRGELWKTYHRFFGQDSDHVLVIQADSRTMNPALPEAMVQKAYDDDPAAASAEYGAQFRHDIESYVRREAVEACVVPGRFEQPSLARLAYVAGFDAAGGSGADEMTLAVAHYEQRDDRVVAVLDLVAGVKPPFSPEQVVSEFCDILARYRIGRVHGDRYAGEWPREPFRKAGIVYDLTEKTKSELYRELLPAINSGVVELLDHSQLISQLCALERKTARGGRDTIDHPPNGHDDVINAAAIALLRALAAGQFPERPIRAMGEDQLDESTVVTVSVGQQLVDESVLREMAQSGRGSGSSWFRGSE